MRKVMLAVALVAAAGCGGKKSSNSSAPAPQPPPSQPNPPPAPPPSGPGLVDSQTAQTLLTKYCAACHNNANGHHAPMGIQLDTLATAKANPDQVTDAIKELTVNDQGQPNDMPPADETSVLPTTTERQQLVQWFKQP